MKRLKNTKQSGFAHLIALIIVVAVMSAIGFIGYTIWQKNNADAVPKLGKASCELRGRDWNPTTDTCTKKCMAGQGSLVTDTYDYCSKAVTASSKLNKANCTALGRKWLAYNGCARVAAQKTTPNAPQCKAGGTYRIHKNFDFCGAKDGARNKFADGLKSGTGGGSGGGIVSAPGKGGCPHEKIQITRGHVNVRAATQRAANCFEGKYPQFRPTTYDGGVGQHPAGRAIDLMLDGTSISTGWKGAYWLKANSSQLDVCLIIFNKKIWSYPKRDQGWRTYTGTSNPHNDHIHVEIWANRKGC